MAGAAGAFQLSQFLQNVLLGGERRLRPNVASFLFGMSNSVAATIAERGPRDIERIAQHSQRELRIRWEATPAFWAALLDSAQRGDVAALREIHLYSLQLLGSELRSQKVDPKSSREVRL
jgi:hypothetical protein